jgi:hypothetical protein
MLPIIMHAGAAHRKPLPVIAANSVVIGTVAGIAGHFLK